MGKNDEGRNFVCGWHSRTVVWERAFWQMVAKSLSFLLLQVRNPDDPMRAQEVRSFARALQVEPRQIVVFDVLSGAPGRALLDSSDMVLLGGSGHYGANGDAAWLLRTLELLAWICETGKPTFASCWGFQAMARAMGGTVVKDLSRAEVGTHWLKLTEDGKRDPLFSPLGDSFRGQMGHEDHVLSLFPGAVHLASSGLVENQAYRVDGKPIYCTQFHPELNRRDLLERVRVYPSYIENIAGVPPEKFESMIEDSPETEALLPRFLELVFGEKA